MKALSIKQPWADWILFKDKDIENRTWKLPEGMKGECIYIHAGKKVDLEVADQSDYADKPERLGAIVGEVYIIDCVTESESEWFEGPYGFVLARPYEYKFPIPCRGMLGFFEPKI